MSKEGRPPDPLIPPQYEERDWYYAYPGEIPSWEAWFVGVKVQAMPDGEWAITGLRIEPNEDFDGRLRDQQITAVRLRSLPLRALLTGAAKDKAFLSGDLQAFARSVIDAAREEHREAFEESYGRRVEEVGPQRARLEQVAELYRQATRVPVPGGPRKQIAQFLGVSVGTVDRRLRDARKAGLLEPFDGSQGKYGKVEEG